MMFFVVQEKDGKQFAYKREIELGLEGISRREIIEGVKAGDLLVTEGKSRLVGREQGEPVEVVE